MKNKGKMVVITGIDYSGKSTLLKSLSTITDWKVISYDDQFLGSDVFGIKKLKKEFVKKIFPNSDQYSNTEILSKLSVFIDYFNYKIEKYKNRNIVVDSYYYKFLYKSLLKGWIDNSIFQKWQNSYIPDKIIFLKMKPEFVRFRLESVDSLNHFEVYKNKTYEDNFVFQSDLDTMFEQYLPKDKLFKLDAGQDQEMVLFEAFKFINNFFETKNIIKQILVSRYER